MGVTNVSPEETEFQGEDRQLIRMARGLQAQQSQAKAAEKQAKLKKMAGNNKHDNAKTAAAGLKFTCAVCKAAMPDPKTYKQHFESKHSKVALPEELKEVKRNKEARPLGGRRM